MDSDDEIVKMLNTVWRELQFYCESKENEWRVFGDKKGIENLSKILQEFCYQRKTFQTFNDLFLGPYAYMNVRVVDPPMITLDTVAGRVEDLEKLAEIIAKKLTQVSIGDTFSIDKEFADNNTAILRFTVMADGFDPTSMDPVLVKNR